MTTPNKPVGVVKPLQLNNKNEAHGNHMETDERDFVISLEGFPEGTTEALMIRCIRTLEHAVRCVDVQGTCAEGEKCSRIKSVLAHYVRCSSRDGCIICKQLMALFRNHSANCLAIKGDCIVPYCKNRTTILSHERNDGKTIKFSQLVKEKPKSEYAARRLSEIMRLIKIKQGKIAHLSKTNPHTTTPHILEKMQKLQRALERHQVKNRPMSKVNESPRMIKISLLNLQDQLKALRI